MLRRLTFILAVMMCVLVMSAAFAAADTLPNDPKLNPDANACYAGGTLEGRCNGVDSNLDGVVSEDEVKFAWVGGWYLIRFQAGMISRADFPKEYLYLLPQEGPTFPQCHDSVWDGYRDYELLAPINTLLNARVRDSEDGSCTGGSGYSLTLVTAPDRRSAETLCINLGAMYVDPSFRSDGYPSLPLDTWMCED